MPRDRGEVCYKCKTIKESRFAAYCRKCKREKDNEWRLSTGRTSKHQTGLCPCGKERASYSKSYCQICLSIRSKNRVYSESQIARRNELQRKRYAEKHLPKKFKNDEVSVSKRKRYKLLAERSADEIIKHRVRALTRSYIKYGKLIKGKCEVCNTVENVEAHHDNYDKPLDVRWLCRKHHREHHKLVLRGTSN